MNPKAETKKRFLETPEEIRNLITSFDTLDQLEAIGKNNKLTQEQINRLGEATTSVLIGFTPTEGLPAKLVAYLVVAEDVAHKVTTEVDQKIFSKVRTSLEKVQSGEIKNEAKPAITTEEMPNKDEVLHAIENPTPAKPAFSKPLIVNPAGRNPILDAQHNLPEGEKRQLISSAAVPSRGPLLSNVKNSFSAQQITPTKPIAQTPPNLPIAPNPLVQPKPIVVQKPATPPAPAQTYPFSQPQQTPKPTQSIQATQAQKQPQTSIPPAPEKYTVDPYREPAE